MIPIKHYVEEKFFQQEIRDDCIVTSEVKKLWAVEIDLLKELDRVCKKIGVKYYASCGTLLGAVRHKGFIPWDDDIDIMMFREDYNRLCENSFEFSEPYFFQTERTEKGCLRIHAQLRNSKTTAILKYEVADKTSINQGIFIDIIPLDDVTNDKTERDKYFRKLVRLRKKTRIFTEIPIHKKEEKNRLKKVIKYLLSPVLIMLNRWLCLQDKYFDEWEKTQCMYNGQDTDYLCLSSFPECGDRIVWSKSDFGDEPVELNFEYTSIPAPCNYEAILEKTYGDWRKKVKGKNTHGEMMFDADISYSDFLGLQGKKKFDN